MISVSRLFTVRLVDTRSQNWLACSVFTWQVKIIRVNGKNRWPGGYRYKPLKINQMFCYNFTWFAITRFDNFWRVIIVTLIGVKLTNPREFRKLLYRALEDKTQLGLWQTFHQILSPDRRDKFTRRQKWRLCRLITPTLTSFFMVSCSRSAFLIESCSSLSRVSKCLLWLFCVSISTSMSCCWFCRR